MSARSLALFKRNLHYVQGDDQCVNSPGILEIPEIVFQEILVNALIHRDYFISALFLGGWYSPIGWKSATLAICAQPFER